MRLEGRVALVVGAGSSGLGTGIGRAIALALAKAGARVFAADINLESAAETARLIEEAGGSGQPLCCDVSSSHAVNDMVEECRSRAGALNVLINNVGIATSRPAVTIDDVSWNNVVATNLSGVFYACRAAIPLLINSGGGSIVNVSSIAAFRWLGSAYASYSASKAGIVGLSRNLALEHARDNVRVNCVLPGFIDTVNAQLNLGVGAGDVEAFRRRRDARCPMGRSGSVWDVANAVTFLASDLASYLTATEIVVDGGLSASVA